ncbi:MAG: hypothetical protein KDB00_11685 [Planctomycetales bacterium]|nr:hypothetical protein [Planctomycetales bacterium]
MSIVEEQTLIDLTTQLKQQYEQLCNIVDALDNDSNRNIDAISEQMKPIKRIEELLRPLRDAYRENGDDVGAELQAITDQTIEVVKTLMPKLASLEKASAESLRRLFPKIQGSVRAVQMQNAYRGNHQA